MKNERIISIDIFRGLTIFIMILGNLSPDWSFTYPTLLHSSWVGINLIDLAFPSFIFIMGVSTVFANSLKYTDWLGKVVKRTFILFVLGLLVNHLPLVFTALFSSDYTFAQADNDFLTYFHPFGVLQRIALVYFFGTIIFQGVSRPWPLFTVSLLLMSISSLGYYLYNPGEPFSEANNISLYIDQHVQGTAHNYMGALYDPEGLYGTINATATMLLGCCGGLMLKSPQEFTMAKKSNNIKSLFSLGIVLILAAWGWSQWEIICKPLWTAPYVLSTAGLAMIMLSLMEGLSHSAFFRFFLHPLKALGRNPIFIYLLSEWGLALLFAIPQNGEPLYLWLYHTHFFSAESPFSSTFAYTLMWDLAFVVLAEIMYWKNIIVKV
ncbi:acyltransferase family protein [Anaerovibrio sp. RM50]|uniref:acyltransferase family protein n=1 Tax=Anaerovibrio sp. RM50 TaxID=1200557 RepID=UPI0004860888|nr:heparan-alpha-glucosaminide N-acetyltransferase domain-containing protein [Anaerovibrio sp. RM50]